MAAARRVPIAPLAELLHRRSLARAGADGRSARPGELAADVLEEIGVTRRTWHRWRAEGSLPFWTADEVCTRLGLHPSALWGPDYWSADDDAA